MNYLLTKAERDRFATWLEREAETAKGIIEQIEKIGGHAVLVAREKQEATAALIIARKLRSIEDETL